MPRAKAVDRKRVLQACAICKRRKEKCDGLQPCANCRKQNNEDGCTYLDSTPKVVSRQPPSVPPHLPGNSLDLFGSALSIGSCQDTPVDTPNDGGYPVTSLPASTTSAPVSEFPRFLQDPKGKFIYIGDSASLSFLQTVRRIVESSIGPCHFTTDQLRHQLIETSPSLHYSGRAGAGSLPDINEALALIREFSVAVSGALDLFDASTITENIHGWIEDPMRAEWPNSSIFYLVLALGAQARRRDHVDDYVAEQYFTQGRGHAMMNLVDDPSLLTVQAFCLITWYMLTACRRNGALMNLGLAVQAAYALGVHRQEANASFGQQMAASRERAWKTLRVCDLFLSASMGRPSITSHIDSNIPPRSSSLSDVNDRLSSSMSRICLIFERILSEVYSHRAVSLDLAASISRQHRSWTEELPGMLEADGISSDTSGPVDLAKTLGSAIVVIAYYYSIILLTRPFLTFKIDSHIRNKACGSDPLGTEPGVTTYSDACVNSAINGIELACDVIRYENMPRRIPLIVNSVFISALALGLAYFGDYSRRGWALEQALEQAIRVLKHFGACSPQSARYQQIVELLRDGTVYYRDQRHESTLKSYKEQVSSVFGNVSAQLDLGRILAGKPSTAYHSRAGGSVPGLGTMGSEMTFKDPHSSPFPNLETIHPSSIFTTSGKLAAELTAPNDLHHNQNTPGYDAFGVFLDDMLSHRPTDLSLGEEVPLFILMNDYDPI